MRTDWRISSFNGVLLAAYFIPTWAIVAFRIMISPIQGLYERPNVSVALFISDHLQLAALTTVRFAWLLALGKLTVLGFFAIFVVLITPRLDPQSRRLRRSAGDGSWHRQRDQFRQYGDGRAGGREPGRQAACHRTVDAARHRDRVAGRTSRSAAAGSGASRSQRDCRRLSL
jgi:hypothetical protein